MLRNNLSGKLFPIHLKPKEDELLSSWIVRLSLAHGLRPYAFASILWPKLEIWDADTDRIDNKEIFKKVFKVLAEKTCTPLEQVEATALKSYEGWLHEKHSPKGPLTWILPIASRHPTPKQFGMQFCPWCLAEDDEPYFRRSWRLAFTVLCTKHDVQLLDRCPHCGEPVNYYRNISITNYEAIDCLTLCRECKFDLRNATTSYKQACVDSSEAQFQQYLAVVLKQGWVVLPQSGYVYSHLFFEGLYNIMRTLFSGREAEKVRAAVVKHYGTELLSPVLTQRSIPILSKFNVVERRVLLGMARQLLSNWPNGFINFCEVNRFWGRTWFPPRRRAFRPYWFCKVVREKLDRSPYQVSEQEFASAVMYLRKAGLEPNKSELSKYFGSYSVERLSHEKPKQTVQGIRECPICHSTKNQVKHGWRTGKQIFRCYLCNRNYIEGQKPQPRLRHTESTLL
jgi:hypothetical protein